MIVEVQDIEYTPGDSVGVASGTLQNHPEQPVRFGVDHRYVEGMIDALERCGGSLPCEVEPWQVLAMGTRRYDHCDDTCTVDCGHCKGKGKP